MAMQHIAHVWHWYQPPWQYPHVLDKIVHETYDWLSAWLATQDPEHFKVSINISGSLTELLQKQGHNHVLDNLRVAGEHGVVEFLDTAAYHPLIPLLPQSIREGVVERQTKKNGALNASWNGSWEPKGFFLPELAISSDTASLLANMGYTHTLTEYTIFDAMNTGQTIPFDVVAMQEDMSIFFRSRWSTRFAMEYQDKKDSFVPDLQRSLSQWFTNGYAVLAYDVETLGHHHAEYDESYLKDYVCALSRHEIKSATLQELLTLYTQRAPIGGNLQGSWSTSVGDIYAGNFFPLWKSNKVHDAYWDFALATAEIVGVNGNEDAFALLDKGLNSCPLWWASKRPWWDSGLVKKGADLLLLAAEAAGQRPKEYDVLLHQL